MKMPWIKMESDLMDDSRILHLYNDLGMKGIGVYLMLRLCMDSNELGCKLSTALDACSYFTSRRMASRVYSDYGLFTRVKGGLCHSCSLDDMRADARAEARAGARTGEPTNKEDIEIEEREEEALPHPQLSVKEQEFYTNMQKNFPRVCQLRYPLTYHEMHRLLEKFSAEEVLRALGDMENYPKLLNKYLSANLTCRKFIAISRK